MAKSRTANTAAAHDAGAAPSEVPLVPTGALAVALLGLVATARPLVHVARDARRLEEVAAVVRALAPERTVAIYPEWDCLPFDRASPSRGVMGARAGVLRWLTDRNARPDIVLTTAPALLQRVPPPRVWAEAHVEFSVGDGLDPEALTGRLRRLGYIVDDRVDEPGEVAIRGRTIDLYPAAAPLPCRVEHDGARVTAIRAYDPVSQRSLGPVRTLVVDPATEIILEPSSGVALEPFTGQEHRLPHFYGRLVGVLDDVPEARLVVEAGTHDRVAAFFEQLAEAREDAAARVTGRGKARADAHGAQSHARGRATELYLTPDEWASLLAEREVAQATGEAGEEVARPSFVRERRPEAAFARDLRARLKAGERVVLAGPGGALRRLVRAAGAAGERGVRPVGAWREVASARPGEILSIEAPIEAGFRVPAGGGEAAATVVAAADLFGATAAGTGPRAAVLPMGEVDLRVGDVAIDRDHGLCVFEGLAAIRGADGREEDALRLRFADDAVLMVPADQADRVWRYGSEVDAVALDRLGGTTWARRRLETEAGLARTARAMLAAAEARRRAKAPRLEASARDLERFAAGFGHPLTGDQARAVDEVLADLARDEPMDRLVCGDVGFGKTEVAMRAAAAAVFAGRQVAVMAPTTVLVRQHVEAFRRRFARFGVEVAHLSRLVPPAEAKRVREGLADGRVRLVVGTQALAGRGVRFRDLGLAIVDEEQRFGTKTKAALREAAGHAHVLTLSATPIPRTLQGALVGLQSLSVIATPPAARQPIRTLVGAFDEDVLGAALTRERGRGGQSFVVCPRIEDIAPMAERLRAIVPGLETITVHGGLRAAEADAAMVRFADGEGDVLLATGIIESGLDVPRANTMLVWDAERFGLAQLHQLRGRVGRGGRRGIVHLVGPSDRPLGPSAEKRLRTLEALDRLGAGFAISARDLDQRGAGDLVGDSQAGHVKLVGVGLYQHLLELALRAAKGEVVEDWDPDVRIGLSGRVTPDYVPETEIRLSLYARLLRLRCARELDALHDEVEDRFGPPPPPVEALFTLARLRVECRDLGIARLSGGPQGIAADFRRGHPVPIILVSDEIVVRDGRVVLRGGSDDARERGRRAAAFVRTLREARERGA